MIEQRVTLRYGAQQIPPCIQAVQGDTGRDIIFELVDYEIPEGATVNYYVEKPSGEAVYNSAEMISSSEIMAHLTQQAIVEVGRSNGQVRVLLGDEVITSFKFVIEVEQFLGANAIPSGTETNIFDEALQAAADAAIEEINERTNVIPYPVAPFSKYGEDGQLLRTHGDGTTEWAPVGLPTDEQTAEAVSAWLDNHPEATTTVQDHSITIEKMVNGTLEYVTPQMYGALADGTNDDSQSINDAIKTGKIVLIPNGTYALGNPIEINNDTYVICSSETQFKPIANLTYLVIVGDTETGFTNPIFSGLVKMTWEGGTFWGADGNYATTDVIRTQKTYHSKFTGISIVNVSTNGVHITGSIGAYCVFENCAVRGKHGNGVRGFLIERSDQLIKGCSVIDCLHGYETNANTITFENCTAWMSTSINWTDTAAFLIGGAFIKLIDCIIDTMYYGIRFKSNLKKGIASNLTWMNNYSVVSDTTNMSLLSTESPSDGYLVDFKVNGLIIDEIRNTAYFKRDVSSAIHTKITNIVALNTSIGNISDFYSAASYSETKAYTINGANKGNGKNTIEEVDGGIKFTHISELSDIASGTVIDIAPTWLFKSISGAQPVTCLDNNSGQSLPDCVLYCNNGLLQFIMYASSNKNIKIFIELFVPQRNLD